jgi:hypothetical protein
VPRLRLVERAGRALGFSPEGRDVRVWIRSRPGEEDAAVVGGTVVEVTGRGAVIAFEHPVKVGGRELSRVLAVPSEPGWGLDALWFAFIPFDAFPAHADGGEPVGRWWMRLGRAG